MKPQKFKKDQQIDLFKIELNRIIDFKHSLAQLAKQIDWKTFDDQFETHFTDEGRPAIATRLMVSLHYLKYSHNLSDEETVARWVENPYWQYLSGRQYFEYKMPIDPSSMTRWRKRVGVEGAELLLSQTIQTAMEQKYLKPMQCQRVSVDTTVQTKDIRFPTDARLYDRMREKIVNTAQDENVMLRQSYARVGKQVLRRQQNYAHAQQGRRAAGQTKRLKTLLGRVVRDVERKTDSKGEHSLEPSKILKEQLILAKQLLQQRRDSKNKIYSIHEPQVQCIAKGKAHQRYEFGCKVGFSVTAKGNWIVGAKAFSGNPYDGHTLKTSLEQTERLTNIKIQQATCDQGYRGHGVEDVNVSIVPRRKNKASKSIRHWWRRRNAIEPIIGHSKSDHRLNRNQLAGELGDQLNAIFSACGFNIKKLMRAFWLWIQNVVNNRTQINFQRSFA